MLTEIFLTENFFGGKNFLAEIFLVCKLYRSNIQPMCRASGIPPYTHLLLRVMRLEHYSRTLVPQILEGTSKLLDEKGVAAGNITETRMIELVERTVRKIMAETRQQLVEAGFVQGNHVVQPRQNQKQ